MPSDNGVTSGATSFIAAKTPPCTAAPTATTSSGLHFIRLFVKQALHHLLH
jgi:hypothetical protein